MVRRFTGTAAVIFLVFFASFGSSLASEAPPPALLQDAECLIATASLIKSDDEKKKRAAGAMGSMFFSGKIFGADPTIDLTGLLRTASNRIDQSRMTDLFRECGQELKMRGEQIQVSGKVIDDEELSARREGSRQ